MDLMLAISVCSRYIHICVEVSSLDAEDNMKTVLIEMLEKLHMMETNLGISP